MAEIYCEEIISKYTYRINEEESEMFLFELVLKKFNQNKNVKLRRVTNLKTGKLIGLDNNIELQVEKHYCNLLFQLHSSYL